MCAGGGGGGSTQQFVMKRWMCAMLQILYQVLILSLFNTQLLKTEAV
jgi:hypothetical protein